jgi:hypothetical protein
VPARAEQKRTFVQRIEVDVNARRRTRRWGWLAAVVGLAAAGAAPVLRAQSSPPPGSSERVLFDRLNQERTRAGLTALAWDSRLAEAARRHSTLMAAHNELSHQLTDEPDLQQRVAAAPLDSSGENVAFGHSPASIHEGFMASPPHRQNILNGKWDAVGIGVVQTGGSYWVTQDFGHLIRVVDSEHAIAQVEQALVEARRRAHTNPLRRMESERLQRLACAMGEQGRPDAKGVFNVLGARLGLAYSTADPRLVPEDFEQLAQAREVDSYAVGACFARSPQYPSGIFWVAVVVLHLGNETALPR